MSCRTCEDKGIVRATWSDAPEDYAVCLCPIGMDMRRTSNVKETGYALWEVWAYREQIDPSRVFFIEEVLTPQELAERGFSMPAKPTAVVQEAALLAAGKRRVKL